MSSTMWHTLQRWLGRGAAGPQHAAAQALSPTAQAELAARTAALQPFAQPGEQRLDAQPLVVIDLETTGLDRKRDTVLSVGAVRIERQAIVLGQSFERVLKVDVPLAATSQLFHGLTPGDLQRGEDPRQVLIELLEWGQDAIWLAWHAWFDQTMLHRAARHWLGEAALDAARLPPVLDLAHAMPLLMPAQAALGTDLDAWLQAAQLGNSARHNAVADAMATAELALVALARAQAMGLHTWGALSAAMVHSQKHLDQQQAARQGQF